MLAKDIGIDLGTANVLIYIKGRGIVLNEPSVVVIDTETKKVLSVGKEANEVLGRTPGKVKAIKPMKDGVIADFELTEIMLNEFIKKAKARKVITRPRILICCPTNITPVEKNAIKEAAERTGARKVYLEEEPKVAAIGAGMNIKEAKANMVLDIGGGTTDIAILSMNGIVLSSSIKVAGNELDQEIIRYIRDKYKLLIGEKTAEDIKINFSNVYKPNRGEKLEIRGRDLITGLPKTITVHSSEMLDALLEPAMMIVDAVHSVLEKTPPELAADISDKGIYMTGGGCLVDGLDKLLQEKTGINVMIAQDSVSCVALGTGKALDNLDVLEGKVKR